MSYGHLRTLMIIQRRGLLLEEIPGILNIGADREAVAGEITIRQPHVVRQLSGLACSSRRDLRFDDMTD
jgi:hypothetical protein